MELPTAEPAENFKPELDPTYLSQEDLAIKQILNAYYEPETTLDNGVGVRAFIEELAILSGNEKKFFHLLKIAKDSISARGELERLALVSFRRYVLGEEEYLETQRKLREQKSNAGKGFKPEPTAKSEPDPGDSGEASS
jgi:hypothetical protein